MELTKLVYSSNHSGLSTGAVESIHRSSNTNNARDEITGVLVVGEEDFLQVLEGERSAVAECFMRIMKDDRHKDVRILLAIEQSQRSFSKWGMYCIRASKENRSMISRYYVDGVFDPTKMSQDAIQNLCLELTAAV